MDEQQGVPVDVTKPTSAEGALQDITERKRVEEALRQANARLDLAIRGTNMSIWEFEMPDGRIEGGQSTLINVFELLGYDPKTVPSDFNSAFALLVHPDDQERLGRELQEFFAGEKRVYETESRARHRDGSDKWHLARGVAIRDSEGKPVRYIGSSVDITRLKRAEEALRQANDRVESALRRSSISIWECDMPDGRIENARLNLFNLWEPLGYDPRTAPTDFTSACAIYFHPDELERVGHDVQELLDSNAREWTNEYRTRTKDGSTRWILARGTVFRDSDGKPNRFIGTSTDITDRKRTDAALQESEARFRQLAENVRGVFWLQEGGWKRVLYISPAYEEVWGRTCQSLYEQPSSWIDSVHREDRDRVLATLDQQNRGEATETEFRIARPDGSIRWVRCGAFPLRNQAGEVYRATGLAEDTTERKQFEEELQRAKEAAEAANRAKDDFLANVSHEIRTPMNAIIGMTELVLDTPLEEGQRQSLKTVKTAADSLLGIINDLLDFSKIEAGKLELVPADFSLRGAVGDTLRALAVRAHKKRLELIYEVQPDVPDSVIGDAGRLRQVLLNLVGNAVKFTDEGEVVVTVQMTNDGVTNDEARNNNGDKTDLSGALGVGDLSCSGSSSSVFLRFHVKDTGIGIPADQQQRIFRAFEQEDTSTTRKYGGTGLGLTIAARLVALMGGTITLDSAPGQGSTFAFTARFTRQPHSAEPVSSPPLSLHDLPVLVVDDNATNRHILAEWLRGWGMNPTEVGDGMAAMDALWHRAANGLPYLLVLLDARMPEADGLALAAKIRERAELASTRIILLTSGERPGDLARARDLRIEAQLLKPVQQDELLDTIYHVLRGVVSGEWSETSSAVTRQEAPLTASELLDTTLQILVGEDNDLSAQVLEQALVRQGHHVRLASNGQEVLALAVQGKFDLLLLDIVLPELDGFQVVRTIRESELTTGEHLPIIALTARSRKEDRERCLAAGMDDFQTKPIRPADLLAAIDRLLTTHPPSRQSRRWDLLDAPVLWAACGGDPTLLRKMCRTLIARVPEHLAALRDGLRDHDAPRLREVAHKCCGTLSEFSTSAGDLAGSLEELAAGKRLDKAAPVLGQLEAMAHELVKVADGITIEALSRKAKGMKEYQGTSDD